MVIPRLCGVGFISVFSFIYIYIYIYIYIIDILCICIYFHTISWTVYMSSTIWKNIV